MLGISVAFFTTRACYQRSVGLVAAVGVGVALAAGCGSGAAAPELGANSDPELVTGREVWVSNCTNCHGVDGGGGLGPKLKDGAAAERSPNVADAINIVAQGNRSMPSFEGRLTPKEIESVVRFTREGLAAAE